MGRSAALQRIGSQQDRWKRQVHFTSEEEFLINIRPLFPGSGAETAHLRSAHNVELILRRNNVLFSLRHFFSTLVYTIIIII